CNPKHFVVFFRLAKVHFLGLRAKDMDIDELVADLLTDKAAAKARDVILTWSEARTSSWADSDRDAQIRAASGGHLPQIRGQLRYHAGQKALSESCRSTGLGAIPMHTTPPGGVFTVARVGRFALVSLNVRHRKLLPRRSITRRMLSQANESLD